MADPTVPCAGCAQPVRANPTFVAYPVVDGRFLFDQPRYLHPACHDPRERKLRLMGEERRKGTPRPCVATGRKPRASRAKKAS